MIRTTRTTRRRWGPGSLPLVLCKSLKIALDARSALTRAAAALPRHWHCAGWSTAVVGDELWAEALWASPSVGRCCFQLAATAKANAEAETLALLRSLAKARSYWTPTVARYPHRGQRCQAPSRVYAMRLGPETRAHGMRFVPTHRKLHSPSAGRRWPHRLRRTMTGHLTTANTRL
jgi:hypothetical protein